MRIYKLFIALLMVIPCQSSAAPQDCTPPKIVANAKANNIFSPEQEMILGELTYQKMSGDLRFIKKPQLLGYINRIGDKLIHHLPDTGLKFQFFIVDIPEANAFNIPGGYVFLSRKLIAFANNEDELAGVIAHELGHAVVRHVASDFSERLKKILNVTRVGDRKDIAEKYNLLIERQRTKDISRGSGHESEQQLEADRIGLFALVAAGYDPGAFASFFDRLAETKGRTGNWFTDIFGKSNPQEKRFREMIKVSEQLPAPCREAQAVTATQQFLSWQADVVSYRDTNKPEDLPGLIWKKPLSPRLRSDISHFSFSADGKYLLAQDDFAITVIQREPLQVMFQIPAPDAKGASFTPDGRYVVFGTEGLRYEKWSVAEKRAVELRELVVRRDCWEHEFSPDGRYLACVDYGTDLNVLDTQTGKKIWEKKDFYKLSFFELLTWIGSQARDEEDRTTTRLFHVEFSPDSRFLIVSRSNKFRFSLKIDLMLAAKTNDTTLALDLNTLKPLSVGGDFKRITRRPFLFLDAGRVLGMGSDKLEEGGVFSFPEGKRLARFSLGGEELKWTANANYVIVKPMQDVNLGVLDLTHNSIVTGLDKADATLWNNLMAYESVSGKVLLAEVQYDAAKKTFEGRNVGIVEIPVASVGRLYAAEISDNFQWLAMSSKTRGGIWNLDSGERKMFIRGFRGVLVGNDGAAIGDFPRLQPVNHSLVFLNPFNNDAKPLREIPENGARQYGRFVIVRQRLKPVESKEINKVDDKSDDSELTDLSLGREVRFELRDAIGNKLMWSRDFPKEAPRFFFDAFSGRLILYWTLGSELGKARLKEDATLAARAKEMGNKDDDYLLEIVDAFASKTVGMLLVETGKGSFEIESGFSEGNWLVLHDSQNRVLAYSLKNGDLHHRFFGATVAINPTKNQMAVENYPGELTFYDLDSGDSLARLILGGDAAFVRFSLDGKRLFVLTDEQMTYAFDAEKLAVLSVNR